MTRHLSKFPTIFFALTACSSPTTSDKHDHLTDTSKIELSSRKTTSDSTDYETKIQIHSFPIHGSLNKKQIDQYYPEITDTIKNRRAIGSEPVDIQTTADLYVSMLQNTGTFNQMFLCTHDKNFNLLDCYYIGTSRMYDKTSHSIEYKRISDDRLEFDHVDWGYVENEIDTLKHEKYILFITKTGKIAKE